MKATVVCSMIATVVQALVAHMYGRTKNDTIVLLYTCAMKTCMTVAIVHSGTIVCIVCLVFYAPHFLQCLTHRLSSKVSLMWL